MPRWVGLLGSWALLVLGLGLTGYAVAGETITFNDARKLRRIEMIDSVIAQKIKQQVEDLQRSMSQTSSLQSVISLGPAWRGYRR